MGGRARIGRATRWKAMKKNETDEDEGIAREEAARARWAMIGCRPTAYNVVSGIINPVRPGDLRRAPKPVIDLLRRAMARHGSRWEDWMADEPIMAFRRFVAPDEIADTWTLAVAPDPRNAPSSAAWITASDNDGQIIRYATKKRDSLSINGFGYRVRDYELDEELGVWRDVSPHDARHDALDGRKLDDIAQLAACEGRKAMRIDPNLAREAIDAMPGRAGRISQKRIAENRFDGYARTAAMARIENGSKSRGRRGIGAA